MSERKSLNQLYMEMLMKKNHGALEKMKAQIDKQNLTTYFMNYKMRIFQNYMYTMSLMYLIIAVVHSTIMFSNYHDDNLNHRIFIYLGSSAFVFTIITIYLKLTWTRKSELCTYILAWMVVLIISLCDLSWCFYASVLENREIRPCYSDLVISAVYLFMPIFNRLQLLLMGFLITALYITGFTYCALSQNTDIGSKSFYKLLVPDIIFLISLNILGFYVHRQRDIILHMIFLTKRENIEETIILKYAKDQEKTLLLSIIPPTIARKIGQEIKDRIESDVRGYMLAQLQTRKLYIETHQDVSILFADVVNYTFLTTKLDIKDLVETLHELFQRIDSACLEYNVTRIKFLGDCYYGVSGVPVSHPLHAVCCIELGRAIIHHIREVRSFRNLDIDMRIGIHSGSIIAGIIGASKWQYDIWSEDVNIANRLEATGAAGRIHVSRATLNLSYDFYSFENGPARAKLDNVLQKYFIYTYLIIDRNGSMESSPEWIRYMQSKVGDSYVINQGYMGVILQKDETSARASKQMGKEINKMPICKINLHEHCFMHQKRLCPEEMEEFKAKRCVSSMFLQYEDWQWELIYMTQPLRRFKLQATIGVFVLICISIMQSFNTPIKNSLVYSTANVFFFTCGLVFIIAIWFDVLYRKLRYKTIKRSRFRPFRKIYKWLDIFLKTVTGRTIIMSCILLLSLLAALLPIMSFDYVVLENDDRFLTEFLMIGNRAECFNSWTVTKCVCLFIVLVMSFTLLPYFYLLGLIIAVSLAYIYLVLSQLSIIYEASIISNWNLKAEISHIWNILIAAYIYNLACRHYVYISKYNLFSRWQLNKKVENSRVTNQSIEVLLHNILPAYVIKVYLARQMNNEPYYEKHRFASIMFATIVHDDMESIDLRLMNEMICDFDDVLSYYKNLSKIEKIKVINWTYMAACGFDILPEDTYSSESLLRASLLPNRSHSNSQEINEDLRASDISGGYHYSFQANEFRIGKMTTSDTNVGNDVQPRATHPFIFNHGYDGWNRQSAFAALSDDMYLNLPVILSTDSEDSEIDKDPRLDRDNDSIVNSNLNNTNKTNNDDYKIYRYNNDVMVDKNESTLLNGNSVSDENYDQNFLNNDKESLNRNHNVFVCKALVHFGLDLIKVVDSMNNQLKDKMGTDFLPLKIRIGMSAGEVMAGIVGCRQAHYDIWGDSVNMASRMDTTGIPNEIQITANVAKILGEHGISSRYRGMTFVKGRGEIPTYFVNISKDREFVPPNTK